MDRELLYQNIFDEVTKCAYQVIHCIHECKDLKKRKKIDRRRNAWNIFFQKQFVKLTHKYPKSTAGEKFLRFISQHSLGQAYRDRKMNDNIKSYNDNIEKKKKIDNASLSSISIFDDDDQNMISTQPLSQLLSSISSSQTTTDDIDPKTKNRKKHY